MPCRRMRLSLKYKNHTPDGSATIPPELQELRPMVVQPSLPATLLYGIPAVACWYTTTHGYGVFFTTFLTPL